MPIRYPLVSSAFTARSLAAAASEMTNLYVEMIENPDDRSKNIAALYGTPGKHRVKDLDVANGSIRGLWSGGGRLFVAQGLDLVEVNSSYAVVSRTTYTAVDDGLPVQMFGNGNQLFIVSGGQAYIDNGAGPVACRFQIAGTFTTVDGTHLVRVSGDNFTSAMAGVYGFFNGAPTLVDTFTDANHVILHSSIGVQATAVDFSIAAGDLVTAIVGGYLDGSFYAERPAGGSPDLGRQIAFSDVDDGTVWRGLNFKSKEGAPDYIRTFVVDSEVIYVFGTETTEAWQNDPTTGVPVRIPGAMVKYGSISRWGAFAIKGKVYFMGGDAMGGPVAYRIDGSTPNRISTHAEESTWSAAGLGVNCICYGYEEEGHTFIVWNFGAQAWHWDETAKVWGRRMSWSGSAFAGYKTFYHTFIPEWGNGKHITAGDLLTGYLYESSVNFYDDNGADIAWRRAIPYRYNAGNNLFFGRQTLEMETGNVASGAEPVITRDYSDDRGNSFVNTQTAGIGVHAATTRRVYWLCGGSSRGRVWRYTGVGQSRVALIDLQAEETLGTA